MSQVPPSLPPLAYASPNLPPKPRSWAWLKWSVATVIVIVAILYVLAASGRHAPSNYSDIPLSEFHRTFLAGNVANVTVEGDVLSGRMKAVTLIAGPSGITNVTNFETELPTGTCNWQFMEWLLSNGGTTRIDVVNGNNTAMQIFVPLIPWILIFCFVFYFLRLTAKRSAAARREPTKVILMNPN